MTQRIATGLFLVRHRPTGQLEDALLASSGWSTRKTWAWPPRSRLSTTMYLPIRSGFSGASGPSPRGGGAVPPVCLSCAGRPREGPRQPGGRRTRCFTVRTCFATDLMQQIQDFEVAGDRVVWTDPP